MLRVRVTPGSPYFRAGEVAIATILWFGLAAICEIAGCFAFWAWLRLDRSVWWLVPGIACLLVFAAALTRVDAGFAGRAYAAYGGIYVGASIVWLMLVERQWPDRWDLIGTAFVLMGTGVILWAPRASA